MKFLAADQGGTSWHHRLAGRVRNWPVGRQAVQLVRRFYGNGTGSEQWQRVVMNERVKSLVDNLKPGQLDTLEISGENWPVHGYFKSHRSVSYPQFDVCQDVLDEQYDLILAEQVFEHLLWPYRAGRNVYRMLRPGGHILISTPFMVPIHECPHDCTRWTSTGLKYFLAECGFALNRIHVDCWGNLHCVKGNLRRWTIYTKGWHSLRHQARYPVQVWALAQK